MPTLLRELTASFESVQMPLQELPGRLQDLPRQLQVLTFRFVTTSRAIAAPVVANAIFWCQHYEDSIQECLVLNATDCFIPVTTQKSIDFFSFSGFNTRPPNESCAHIIAINSAFPTSINP